MTHEAVKEKLEEYINSNQLSASVKVILQKDFILTDDYKIEIPIGNKVEISMLQNVEAELLAFLRQGLQNTRLNLEYKVVEAEKVYKPYTGAEILQDMIKRNPALQKLKDDLGLDPDF